MLVNAEMSRGVLGVFMATGGWGSWKIVELSTQGTWVKMTLSGS